MTDHPGDNADNRFRAFWAGLLGFVSFGVVLMFALKGCGPGKGDQLQLAGVDRQIVEIRKANLAEVRSSQASLVPGESLETAKDEVLTALAAKTPGKTELIVPNSPTDIKRLQDAQKQSPAAASEDGKTSEESNAPEQSEAPADSGQELIFEMSLEPQQAKVDDLRERTAIDRSVRYPVMFFFTSAAAWLFLATLLGFFSSLKLQVPGLWEKCEYLSYGRLFPMHMNALVYGWAMQAGIGVMIWLMARLTRVELRNPTTIVVAGHVWNFGVCIAVLGIWFGFGRSIPWLDFPAGLWPMLALTYLMILVWLVPMFQARRTGRIYISELFVIGAAVWFPWIFATANLVINDGGSAVMGAGVNAWYITNLIYFWFAPVALAVVYYIIPKIAGRPIHSYPMAHFGFWALAILAGWTGFNRFAGGPFPAWMPAISGAATVLILLAIIVTGANQLLTLKGKTSLWGYSPALRFTMLGSLMFVIYAVLSAGSASFAFGKSLQFSHFLVGLDTLAVYGFFSMTMFGAIYFITPRITRCEWPSGALIQKHFWLSAYGIGTIILSMLLGGLAQGAAIGQWDQPFLTSVTISKPWLVGRTIAWFLIAIANLGFFYQLALMFAGKGRKSEGPTLMHVKPGEAKSAEAAAGLA